MEEVIQRSVDSGIKPKAKAKCILTLLSKYASNLHLSLNMNCDLFSLFKLRENVPEDRVKSRKCGTCLKN